MAYIVEIHAYQVALLPRHPLLFPSSLLAFFHFQWRLSLRHQRRHRLLCVLSPWLEVALVVVVLNFVDSSTRAAFYESRCESFGESSCHI